MRAALQAPFPMHRPRKGRAAHVPDFQPLHEPQRARVYPFASRARAARPFLGHHPALGAEPAPPARCCRNPRRVRQHRRGHDGHLPRGVVDLCGVAAPASGTARTHSPPGRGGCDALRWSAGGYVGVGHGGRLRGRGLLAHRHCDGCVHGAPAHGLDGLLRPGLQVHHVLRVLLRRGFCGPFIRHGAPGTDQCGPL